MSQVPYAFALAAGMLAAVNPCGFALLPAWLALLVVDPDRPGGVARSRAVGRALSVTAAMTGGFVAVFGAFGLVVAPFALSVQRSLPWATIVIGVVLACVGGWLLTGRKIPMALPAVRGRAPTRSPVSMGLYGVSYAVVSLSCAVGPFLAATTSAFRAGSPLGGVLAFLAYAAGMGLVVGVLAVGAALARGALAQRMRRALPYVTRAGGGLLGVAGTYVAYYGWYELRVFGGGPANDPVIGAAASLQGSLVRWVQSIGPIWFVVVLAALSAAGLGARAVTRLRVGAGAAPLEGGERDGPGPSSGRGGGSWRRRHRPRE